MVKKTIYPNNRLRIDIFASLPGPAEALVPVIEKLSTRYDCRIYGISPTRTYHNAGGSLAVFKKHFPQTIDLTPKLHQADHMLNSFNMELSNLILLGAVKDLSGDKPFMEKDVFAKTASLAAPKIQFVDQWCAWSPALRSMDYFFVIDNLSQQVGEKILSVPARFFISGHPGLERFFKSAKPYHPPSGKKKIGYFTQVNVDSLQTIAWLKEIIEKNDCLVIKKHPRDNRDYSEFLNPSAGNIKMTDQAPEALYPTLSHVVTHTSVVALKSALLSIPTINVLPRAIMHQTHEILGGYPLARAGFSREVNSLMELKNALNEKPDFDPGQMIAHFKLDKSSGMFAEKIDQILSTSYLRRDALSISKRQIGNGHD